MFATAHEMAPPAPSSHGKATDENDPACGRGWVVLGTAGRLVGHFYIHNGDESGFLRACLFQQPALMFAVKGLGVRNFTG